MGLNHIDPATLRYPENIHIWLALAWCYKRTDELARAIDALEQALEVDPTEALLLYNLACYWSLSGDASQSVDYLAKAFELDANYRELVELICEKTGADFDEVVTRTTHLGQTSNLLWTNVPRDGDLSVLAPPARAVGRRSGGARHGRG